MIVPDSALALVIEHTPEARIVSVPIQDALGACLAEPVVADRDYPPFRRATMDGFAVKVCDAGRILHVVGELAAGDTWGEALIAGTTIEIMTGAPCPEGVEAVVQKEVVTLSDGGVLLPDSIKLGLNIAPIGAECERGKTVLDRGALVTPLAIANLATFGYESVNVFARPKLTVITTGNEVASPGEMPGPAQIRNSNGPMLAAMARCLGLTEVMHMHARDTMEELEAALNAAAESDIVVLTGAVSAGKYDNVPEAIEGFGAEAIFHKVAQRPGKPIFFAVRKRQLLFGLPGNPLSAHLGFHRYVATAIRKLTGAAPEPVSEIGELTDSLVVKGPRCVFQLAHVVGGPNDWLLTPLIGAGSADMHAAASANAVIRFEPESGLHPAGMHVPFEWTPPRLR